MRCLTIQSWIVTCLCSLFLSGCAVNQAALFSIPPEIDKRKVVAISQSAAVRKQSTAKKTIEDAKPDQFRVTGFNKGTLKHRAQPGNESKVQISKKLSNDSDLEFDEFADFHAIELAEYSRRQKSEIEVDVPVEAKKPVFDALPTITDSELIPVTEVSFRSNTEVQSEKVKIQSENSAELVDLGLKPLNQLSISAKPPAGEMPKNTAAEHLDKLPTQHIVMGDSRDWELVTKEWEAPGVAYNPLYFEEPNLERYGYNYGAIQPFVSAGRFFGRVAILPYMIGAYPIHENRYSLGYARPGDDPLYQVEKLPFSARGALFESLTATGLVFLIP
ncbi:hypothetical protein [uncultured Gimesia sp.]|uniref:hypothetical protein n=1 Tax=uncultured Gimesia sp. TaxID=1678688 RepID=UPI0026038BD8|nr:hypothetical protein [uncultured Gimesia sp.]